MKKENEYCWVPVHEEAFKKLKSKIVKDMTLKYLNPSLPIYIETNASKKDIDVVLMQPDSNVLNTSKSAMPNKLRPVYCASKTFTNTESNYSVVLLHCGCLSLNPFIEFSIRNNSSSSDVLNIQASISISPKYVSK